MMKRLLYACALWSLTLVGAAQAKVLIVADVPVTTDLAAGEIPAKMNLRGIRAVTTILDRYGAEYKVVSPTQINTQMCRIGVLNRSRRDVGFWRYDSVSAAETFDAVIHVGFNGKRTGNPAADASSFGAAGYNADSLTLAGTAGAQLPSVPQLMLLDDIMGVNSYASFDNGARDSTWVATSGYLPPGSGGGNHEGEGSTFSADNPALRWFDTVYGSSVLKKSGTPEGGMRVLLACVGNATFTKMEDDGQMVADPDSASYSNTDTMKVWVKLNEYGSQNGADVVFATCFASISQDSAEAAGGGSVNTYTVQPVNWPVLMFALAHMDSLTGGNVLGSKKVLKWGVGITHAGNTSDRRHPGGFFLADSSIVAASMDSVKATGVKAVIFADPESLAVRPWQVAIFNRAGSVRWAPVVQSRDSLVDGMTSATFDRPIDVWGRYRNRAIYGDSTNHTVMGSDSSIYSQLKNARRLLVAQVGGNKLSTALLAPDFDWSPYQLRAHQNAVLLDSLLWLSNQLGGPLLTLTHDRDMDPAYSRTNPRGWVLNEGRYRFPVAGSARVLGISPNTVRGSQVGIYEDGFSFLTPNTADTTAPLCDASCPSMNASVWQESRFWYGIFGPGTDLDLSQGAASDGAGKTFNVKDQLYQYQRASVLLLPAQTFGGQSSATPSRWGYFVIKHLMNATKAINAKAGRTVIANDFPEDIEP